MDSVLDQQHHVRQLPQQLTLQQDGLGDDFLSPLKKGPWTAEEDALLLAYVHQHGENNWNCVRRYAGVSRCGKSCRLRWTNHLRPDLKKGPFTAEEERIVIEQHAALGNRWSRISSMLHGRTDNDVKNFWNTRVKRLLRSGQPLYPAEIIPSVYDNSLQDDLEQTASQKAGDTLASCCKSEFTIEQDQSNIKGEASVGKACLDFGGARTGNGKAVDAGVFPTVSPNVLMRPCSLENGIQGVKRAREEAVIEPMGNMTGGSLYSFSPYGVCAQSDHKARQHHGTNLVGTQCLCQGFPYDLDGKSSTFVISKGSAGSSCENGSKQSSLPASCNLSVPRHEMTFQCFNIELPSVQLAESADSSSSLSSPFSMGQTLPLSEVDSFGSAINECVSLKSGKLLDVLLQHNSISPNKVPAEMVEQLLAITSSKTSPEFAGFTSSQNAAWMASNDPLSLLGGRSLTLFNDDIKEVSRNSLSNMFEGPLSSSKMPSGRDSPQLKSSKQVSPPAILKAENQSLGPCVDDELCMLLAFEKPDGSPVADMYADGTQVGTLYGCQDEGYHLGGLEAIFGPTSGIGLEQLAAMSGISNAWELSSCAWNSMPGAL